MASELIERLRDRRLEAVVAIEAEDYDTACKKLLAAKAILDTMPFRQGKDGHEFENREIESLLKRVEKERDKKAGHHKARRIPIEHVAVTSDED